MTKIKPDEVYENKYSALLNSGAIGWVSSWTHKTLERGLDNEHYSVVLELGAGQGQHLEHVRHSFDKYYETDVRIKLLKDSTRDRQEDLRVSQILVNAEDLTQFGEESVDRIVLSCLLAHLERPKTALMEMRRVLKKGGRLDIYLPSEPGFLLRLMRFLTTVPKAQIIGFSHLPFHYQEHRNHYLFMKYVIFEVFGEDIVQIRSYPIRWTSWNLSLWKTLRVTKNSQ